MDEDSSIISFFDSLLENKNEKLILKMISRKMSSEEILETLIKNQGEINDQL